MNEEMLQKLSKITEEEQIILKEQQGINTTIYTEERELIIDCEKLLQKGKLIQVRPHTRFVHFPKHRHNYVEVIYMCKGSTKHIIDGNEVILTEGDLLFLNQNASQEIFPAQENDIAINFIILPEFFDTAFAMMEAEDNLLKDFLVGSLSKGINAVSYLYFHVADILPIQNLIENMAWTLLYNQPNKRSINQNTMGLLVLQLLNYLDKIEVGKNQFDQDFIVTVLSYVESNYKSGSLAELAEIMNYNVYWLSREIKKRTGRTYKEILQTKRMNQTIYLLKNSRLSVLEIISSIGYDNTSYFFRKFKERYGMSPKEYRDKT